MRHIYTFSCPWQPHGHTICHYYTISTLYLCSLQYAAILAKVKEARSLVDYSEADTTLLTTLGNIVCGLTSEEIGELNQTALE